MDLLPSQFTAFSERSLRSCNAPESKLEEETSFLISVFSFAAERADLQTQGLVATKIISSLH